MPPDFTAVSETPFSIKVQWNPTDSSNQTLHGVFYTYYVFYRMEKSGIIEWENIGTSNTTVTLKGLVPGSMYGIRILIAVTHGNGIASKEHLIKTSQGCK